MKKAWGLGPAVAALALSGCHVYHHKYTEAFSTPMGAVSGRSFGPQGVFTFSLGENGTFIMKGNGVAWERSDSYRDSAFIRSTKALPKTYRVTAVVGDIDYGLDKLDGLENDPAFPEGPLNENGCYLLTITDEVPNAPHTNIWWHQHRKLVIDVDNNVWGHGMPNPIFEVYFDKQNRLNAFDGQLNSWVKDWNKAVTYHENTFYKVQVEKTAKQYILRVFTEGGQLLKEARVDLGQVWHADEDYEDYFALGDPHANYYQGSMKIKSITLEY